MANLNLNPFPDAVHQAAKAEALSQRISLKQYIIECLCRDMGISTPERRKHETQCKKEKHDG
jgi:HicB family